MNNLEERLKRHLSKKKKTFWHIDYFLKKARVIELKTIKTDKRIECKINKMVKKLGSKPVPKFGSSDCKCEGHLHYFEENPTYRKEFHSVFEERV
jgi:Uri superfamily endonuclease